MKAALIPLLLFTVNLPQVSALTEPSCASLSGTLVQPYNPNTGNGILTGFLAIPSNPAPTRLIVFSHGFAERACAQSAISILNGLAHEGAIAVAMDFRGPWDSFKVHTGIQDDLAAIHDLKTTYPSITTTIVWGFSMGGLISSLLARNNPGLVDYLVVDSGVSNILETYATAPVGAVELGCSAGDCLFGFELQSAIKQEYGDPATNLSEYVNDSPGVTASGFEGGPRTYILHAVGDTVVTVDQAVGLGVSLRLQGVVVTNYFVPSVFHAAWAYWTVVGMIHSTVGNPPLGVYLCNPVASGCSPVFIPG